MLASHTASTPGPDTPLIDPMSAILLRNEASSCSQIENVTVGARQLALAVLDQSSCPNAQLVLKNVHAMGRAIGHGYPVSDAVILAIHEEILIGDPDLADHAGQTRRA